MNQESPDPDRKRGEKMRKIGEYYRYSTLGIQFALCIALPLVGGIYLDRWLGTRVLFTLLGLVYGFGAGVYSVYRVLYPPERRERDPGDESASSSENSDPD